MSLAFDIAYLLGAAASSPVWGYRLWRTGKWKSDWAGRLGKTAPLPGPRRPTLLLHAVSVGEVNATRALVEELGQLAPELRLVISTTTNTGYARACQLYEPRLRVVRYPLDLGFAVSRFLSAIEPDAVALVELELWPNFAQACRRRSIPLCVINGRLSARSFARYRRVRALLAPSFAGLALAAVQTPDYAQRFTALGTPADKVQVTDSMKWDTAVIADEVPGSDELAKALGIDRNRPLIVAGSTGPGEEKLLLDTCPPEAQLLLVPRLPERFDEVAALAPGIVRRSRHPDGQARPRDDQRLFLLDTMGELRKAYALADVCLVGRSFLGLYGSDPIEPVALGKPVVIGPCHSDFADIVAALSAGGGIAISAQPGPRAAALLADRQQAGDLARRGRSVILTRQGATRRHAQLLLTLLPRPAAVG